MIDGKKPYMNLFIRYVNAGDVCAVQLNLGHDVFGFGAATSRKNIEIVYATITGVRPVAYWRVKELKKRPSNA